MQNIDDDMLARAQRGDETALAALIARLMPAIRKGAAACQAPGLDFEDAVQYFSALQAGADLIITRDPKGFKDFDLPAMSPSQFIDRCTE